MSMCINRKSVFVKIVVAHLDVKLKLTTFTDSKIFGYS